MGQGIPAASNNVPFPFSAPNSPQSRPTATSSGSSGPARFTQAAYTIQTTTCTPGSIVGGVQAVGTPGRPCVYVSNSNSPYSVLPSTGQIVLTAQTTGQTVLSVLASCPGSTGPASTTVTMVSSCAITPVFSRQFYDFQAPSCNPGMRNSWMLLCTQFSSWYWHQLRFCFSAPAQG